MTGNGEAEALVPDPLTAPVVRRIFEAYVNGSGLQAIAEQLTADDVLCPSAYDPQRNPHHIGHAWSKASVRAIVTNERYTANDAHVQPTDCAECELRCATRHQVALIPATLYRRAQDRLARHATAKRADRSRDRDTRRYLLRGLLRCDLCKRLMQGSWKNQTAYYRCRFPPEYARANQLEHPPNVYLREDRLVGLLQEWICRALPARILELAGRQQPAVRRRLIERGEILRQLAGPDPMRNASLVGMLRMRLVYRPQYRLVHVRTEILPGALVLGSIQLEPAGPHLG